ncbi:MAG: tannase/feruloyl esterase family alpha/beta hydrolase [Hyphomicrobiaceae bacterium]|nr:tannase/feruloyl esterase family alpha/beta hydrolase [Hyphomicrobiaceae bacterium]
MRGRLPLWQVLSALTLANASVSALAQNGYSFIDAERSASRYALAPVRPQAACADLSALSTSSSTILAAEPIAEEDGVPQHCRVSGLIAPQIRFEINLPSAWNRRFYMFGNGGFAGESPATGSRPRLRATALLHGFVTASTNTGHDATSEPLATFATSDQKRIDYAFRAVHLTAIEGKRIAAAYFDRFPAYSYWDGCSTGGRQGLISAQRFPGDFDGIVAGAPVLAFVDALIQSLWNGLLLADTPLPVEKLRLVGEAVYARCDAKDGAEDGVIEDPRKCDFDPERHLPQCSGPDQPSCLTPPQSAAIKKIYAGATSGGRPLLFGYPLGAEVAQSASGATPETGWNGWLIAKPGEKSRHYQFGESFVRYFALPKAEPDFDVHSFNFDKDPPRLDELRKLLDASNPDLSAFRSHGGKLIMYFGWADMALPPLMGIDYYEKAMAKNGADTPDFFRLFMVPGMFHCRGGVGTDRFDAMTALIDWVEKGQPPAMLMAARVHQGRLTRTRPLCPYPQYARYLGSGSTDEAASFACRNDQ